MADTPAPAHPHNAASGTVTIAGHKVKKSTATVAAAAAGLVIVVAVMRKRSASAAASGSASGMVTDPAGNQCSALNPSTGYCPGTAQDLQAQADASGAASLNSASQAGLSGGGSYYVPSSGTGTSATGSAVPAFTDNASWAQYAETALGSNGSDAIAAALAKYLSGQPVTDAQQTTIEEAIAIANRPPVAGPGGNPPSMVLAPAPPTPPGGGGGGSGGGGVPSAAPASVSAKTSPKDLTVSWAPAAGATHYRVLVQGPDAGHKAMPVVTHSPAVFSIATAGHNGTVKVQAGNAHGYGPWSPSEPFTFLQTTGKPQGR
jgi:hypothetical protein